MSRGPRGQAATAAALAIVVAPFLVRTVAPASLAGAAWDTFFLFLGSLSKLAFQGVAAALCFFNTTRFDAPQVRTAWRLLGGGLLALFVAQSVLAPYQLLWRIPSPFPSWADAFFVLAYPLLVTALVLFLRAYEEAGFPMGSRAGRLAEVGLILVVSGLVVYGVLRPVAQTQAPGLEKAISLAYPALDLVLLAPACLLLRVAWRLRGGSVQRIWLLVVAGIVAMALADVLFAYFSILGFKQLDPLVDAGFIMAYGLLALATVAQHELLRS